MRLLPLIVTLVLAPPLAAQTLDRIRDTGQMNIGFRSDAAPLSYVGPDGKPAGYSPLICDRIAQAVAGELGLETLNATFLPVGAKDRFDKVAAGEVDLHCGAATITLTRRETVSFSIPTYIDGTALVLPADASETLSDLAGKKVGMRSGTTTEQAVRNSFAAAGIDAEMVPFVNHQDGIRAMIGGEIDAYFADQSILMANFVAADMAGRFKMNDQILTLEKHGLAMARGDEDFRLFVDRVLSDMYADGTMRAIFEKALPGVSPGQALEALYLVAPTLP